MTAENTGATAENTTQINEKLDPLTEMRGDTQAMRETLDLSLDEHGLANQRLESLIMLAGAGPTPEMVQNMVINAQNVIVNGANFGGGGESSPIMIENRTTVELDGDKVGQSVGNKIVQQGANRRNLLGRDD